MTKFYKKVAIISLFFLLAFAALIYFLLLPTYNRLNQDKLKLAEKKTVVENNNNKISALQKTANKSNDFDKIYTDVNDLWPDTSKISDFIVQVESLAKDSGILIDSISIDEQKQSTAKPTDEDAAKKAKTPIGTKFTLTFKSDYKSAFDLIQKMENLARFNSVSSLNINSDEQLSVSIIGTIYYGK